MENQQSKKNFCCVEVKENKKQSKFIVAPAVWLVEDKTNIRWPDTESAELFTEIFLSCSTDFEYSLLPILEVHGIGLTYHEADAIRNDFLQNDTKIAVVPEPNIKDHHVDDHHVDDHQSDYQGDNEDLTQNSEIQNLLAKCEYIKI